MRQIGTLPDAQLAQRFADHLLTLGIRSRVDALPTGAAIWVYDEDQRVRATEELQQFSAAPEDPRYEAAAREARRLQRESAAQEKRYQKNVVDLRQQWNAGRLGSRPVTVTLIAISLIVALISRFGEDALTNAWTQELFIVPLRVEGNMIVFPRDLAAAIYGQWWRLVTPIFLHFSLLHLIFNALAVLSLGTPIELRRGSWRMVLLVLAIAIPSNVAQFYYSGPVFGGLSGVAFGLFGYLWAKSYFDPAAGFWLPQSTILTVMVWYALCFTGLAGPIANVVHTVGLAVGALAGATPSAWRRLRR